MFGLQKTQDPLLQVQVYRVDNFGISDVAAIPSHGRAMVNYFDTIDYDPSQTAGALKILKQRWFNGSRLYRQAPSGLHHLSPPKLIQIILNVSQRLRMVSSYFFYYSYILRLFMLCYDLFFSI